MSSSVHYDMCTRIAILLWLAFIICSATLLVGGQWVTSLDLWPCYPSKFGDLFDPWHMTHWAIVSCAVLCLTSQYSCRSLSALNKCAWKTLTVRKSHIGTMSLAWCLWEEGRLFITPPLLGGKQFTRRRQILNWRRQYMWNCSLALVEFEMISLYWQLSMF